MKIKLRIQRPIVYLCALVACIIPMAISQSVPAADEESASASDKITIVTLGDSITKGYRTGVTRDETFSALLEAALREKQIDATVINVGIGGERSDQALERLTKDVIEKKPQFVTIMYGTNDSYIDAGTMNSRLTVDQYRRNLVEIIGNLRGAGIVPILMTEPRWGDKAQPNGLGEHPNVRLEPFMRACRKVAEQLKVPLVDHYETWSREREDGIDIGEWTTDQCHPNPAGHRFMMETMLPTMKREIAAERQ